MPLFGDFNALYAYFINLIIGHWAFSVLCELTHGRDPWAEGQKALD